MNSIITKITARAMPLRGDDTDTDRIIPARYLRCVTFDGLGKYAFQDERFDPAGKTKSHAFNEKRYEGAGILIVNRNFGCGSSREHAPQALARWGLKAIIGESFADIFSGNCAAIGLVAVTAEPADIARLQEAAESGTAEATIDLQKLTVSLGTIVVPVKIPESRRSNFIAGTWDTTASLAANERFVSERAAKIPYLNRFV
jgi:3-isopropylmalate/(R)-2-methylmalate dehydratase small subunit